MNTLDATKVPSRRREHGVVLVISLLMLLILTVIGLAASRSSTIEQRMTANQNDQEVAFEAAEAALRDGEGVLSGASLPVFANNTAGAYLESTMGAVTWQNIDWTNASVQTLPFDGGIFPTPSQPPRYYIVQSNTTTTGSGSSLSADQPLVTQTVYFIYARGFGVTGNSYVTLQSAYGD